MAGGDTDTRAEYQQMLDFALLRRLPRSRG